MLGYVRRSFVDLLEIGLETDTNSLQHNYVVVVHGTRMLIYRLIRFPETQRRSKWFPNQKHRLSRHVVWQRIVGLGTYCSKSMNLRGSNANYMLLYAALFYVVHLELPFGTKSFISIS